MTGESQSLSARPSIRTIGLIVLVCAVVYFPFLGASGFRQTEGHRVIPAWEMLDTGEYLLTHMFDQLYLRKPPGMPWAVAISSAIFGQTEFAARAVSAVSMTALALLSAFFAARWFGRPWALWAGLAAALTPLLWSSGRAAEIEALNNVATAASVFLLIEMLVVQAKPSLHRQIGIILAAAGAITLTALAKGPAGFAAIGAVLPAACIAHRSFRPVLKPALWVSAAISACILGALFIAIRSAAERSGQEPVVQGVSDFLWSAHGVSLSSILEVALMPPEALLTLFPASLAILFVWSRPKQGATTEEQNAYRTARVLGLTCILSLGLLAVLGVQNPRYAMPSLIFLPVLAAFVARGAAGMFDGRARQFARALLPAGGMAWLAALLIAAVVYTGWYQQRQRIRTSGLDSGMAMAAYIPDGATVYADLLIEARPEVLLYARRAAAAEGRTIHIRWIPGLADQKSLPAAAGDGGTYLALRTDSLANEADAMADLRGRMDAVATGGVHRFKFLLVRLREAETVE